MALDFCAIDFETANWFRGSPCAVGLVRVLDGRVAETRHDLMRPPEEWDFFDDFNVGLHGITKAMVRGKPRFKVALPGILEFASGLPFVAHNAAFDMGVIRDACEVSWVEYPSATYACTLVFARRTWPLLSFSLPWVAEAAGASLDAHHDPEQDALAAARILLAIADHHGAVSLDEVAKACCCSLGQMNAEGWSGCHRAWWPGGGGRGYPPVPGANPNADPDHPLYGREIVFTGKLSLMTREVAWERVAEVGAQPAERVTKKTNVLVMGYQDARVLRPGEALSQKARRVQELLAEGREIEVMPEVDFLRTLAP